MKLLHGVVAVFSLIAVSNFAQSPERAAPTRELPLWAYPVDQTARHARRTAAPDTGPQHVPGSTESYTEAQIRDLFAVPDWFPNSHPPMPPIVANGIKPGVFACGYCHLPNGLGRPENQSVAGLPEAYIEQQLADFKSGLRISSAPRLGSASEMVLFAQRITPDEAQAAAAYFSSMKLTPWIRVVESDTAPKTKIERGMLIPADGGGMEPIGNRVIEVPENLERTELRDPNSGFIAYVPKGSVKRGENLVMTGGNGRTIRCTLCHGENLKGLGYVPSIAGRSPSQMARQIIDIQTGARNGPWTQLMKEPVAKLTDADIVAITAYLASLKP